MKIGRILQAEGWKYAISEVFLIVIGVSLALMASAWYERSQDRREELLSLAQLKVALETDVIRLETLTSELRHREEQLLQLYEVFQGGQALFDDVTLDFRAVTTWYSPQLRTGPYEEIKNRGFSLISKASLRSALVDLYEQHLGALQTAGQADVEFSSNQIGPYFNAHFTRLLDGKWAPVEGYDALLSDVYFRNLVIGKLQRLQLYFLPACDTYLEAARAVLEEIDAEIARLAG